MKCIFLFAFVIPLFFSCEGQKENDGYNSQNPKPIVGGGCEGCELMYVNMPETLSYEHTSSGWMGKNQKLQIEGTVYKLDGVTPASGVIVYYWHTDEDGLYKADTKTPPAASRHGRLRGWIKTGADGKYRIRTLRPAPYPNADIPAHIHVSVKEPNIANEYYLDWYFDDDKLYLNHKKKYGQPDRGGTELLRVLLNGDIQIAEHDIILGLNIPNYPTKPNQDSGLNIGEDQPSFIPYHAYGPDAGKRTCPVCKYGRYHGIVLFAGKKAHWKDLENWIIYLEAQSAKRNKYLKAYFVYGSDDGYDFSKRQKELAAIGQKLKLKHTALTFVPSWDDLDSEAYLNKIDPNAMTTMIIYKHRTIVNKFINLAPTRDHFDNISRILDDTQGLYFDLTTPDH